MPAIPEEQVSAANDDAWYRASDLQYGRNVAIMQVGHESTPLNRSRDMMGMLWRTVPIPNAANIISATFSVKASSGLAGNTVRSKIWGEDVDDAAEWPAGSPAFVTRLNNGTTAIITWDSVPAFVLDTWYASPDISSIIQQIVDKLGWVQDNNLAIFWNDDADLSDNGAYRAVYQFDFGVGGNAPKLNVTYSSAGQVISINIR